MFNVDLNCDIGESFGVHKVEGQAEIMKYITSANIACGFHSGDPGAMHETVLLAKEHNVQIGAHPGLPDLLGFGRREMNVTAKEIYDMVIYQIGALQGFLSVHNIKMQHVKAHGALYNMAARNSAYAEAIAKAVHDFSPALILFGLSGSELIKAGHKYGLVTAEEVFADRTYQNDGTLTSRKETNALITDTEVAVEQVLKMIKEGKVNTQQNEVIDLKADTVCIHGDGENAINFSQYINQTLLKNDIAVKAVNQWKVGI